MGGGCVGRQVGGGRVWTIIWGQRPPPKSEPVEFLSHLRPLIGSCGLQVTAL
jgi:hypothetical protein